MNSTVDSPVPYSSQVIGTPAFDVTPSRSGYPRSHCCTSYRSAADRAGRALGREPAQEPLDRIEAFAGDVPRSRERRA
jgi:hypothetical protein